MMEYEGEPIEGLPEVLPEVSDRDGDELGKYG